MNNAFFIILLFTASLSCKKENNTPRINQEILFQVEYVNYAWGHQHHCILIDSSGNVWRYNLLENWHFVNLYGYISDNDMKENLQKSELTSIKIEKDTLLKYLNKLVIASHGKLTEPKHEGNDMGVVTYSGFFYDFNKKRYKEVLINQFGDISIENESKAASEILNWLKNINKLSVK